MLLTKFILAFMLLGIGLAAFQPAVVQAAELRDENNPTDQPTSQHYCLERLWQRVEQMVYRPIEHFEEHLKHLRSRLGIKIII